MVYRHIKQIMEYCCIIWNPIFNIDVVQIEKVQKNFTRFMFSKLNWNMDRPSYFVRCKLFGLDTLECRRNMYSVVFVRDLIHNNIICSSLLAQFNFFRLKQNRSNVSNKGSLSGCVQITNIYIYIWHEHPKSGKA